MSVFLELGLRQIDVVCQHDEYLKIRFQIGRSANPAVSFVLVITKREKTLQILDSEVKIRDSRIDVDRIKVENFSWVAKRRKL